jgi:hypothetical protein
MANPDIGFENGGPAGLVYGFLIAWLSTLFVPILHRIKYLSIANSVEALYTLSYRN